MISAIPIPTDGSKTAQKAGIYTIDLAKKLHNPQRYQNTNSIDKKVLRVQFRERPDYKQR